MKCEVERVMCVYLCESLKDSREEANNEANRGQASIISRSSPRLGAGVNSLAHGHLLTELIELKGERGNGLLVLSPLAEELLLEGRVSLLTSVINGTVHRGWRGGGRG